MGHQTNPYPPPCTKPVHQRTQDIYSNLQTSPPPPQTKNISTPPLNSQMIQQKTHDIYKNLQTPPPPQETKSLNHPTYNRIRKFALEKQQEHQETNNPEANTTNSQQTGNNPQIANWMELNQARNAKTITNQTNDLRPQSESGNSNFGH